MDSDPDPKLDLPLIRKNEQFVSTGTGMSLKIHLYNIFCEKCASAKMPLKPLKSMAL
jgi:hypothetical protein